MVELVRSINDSYELRLPKALPAGEYELSIGLYACELAQADDCANAHKPMARDENGVQLGESVRLATIVVDAR